MLADYNWVTHTRRAGQVMRDSLQAVMVDSRITLEINSDEQHGLCFTWQSSIAHIVNSWPDVRIFRENYLIRANRGGAGL